MVEELKPSYAANGNVKMVQPLWKFPLLKNFNLELRYDPTIPLLDIFLGEMKTYIHQKTFTKCP